MELVLLKKGNRYKSLSNSVQKFYNSPCCGIILEENKNLDEVLNFIIPD